MRWIYVAVFPMRKPMDLSCLPLSTVKIAPNLSPWHGHTTMLSTVIYDADHPLLRPYHAAYTINSSLCNHCVRTQWCAEYHSQCSPIPVRPAHNYSIRLGNVVHLVPNFQHFVLKQSKPTINDFVQSEEKRPLFTNKHITDMRFREPCRYHSTVHTCEKYRFRLWKFKISFIQWNLPAPLNVACICAILTCGLFFTWINSLTICSRVVCR